MGEPVTPTERLSAALREIGERCEKATKGPWDAPKKAQNDIVWHGEGLTGVGTMHRQEDRTFIAHSRQDVPRLLLVVAEMEALLTEIASEPHEYNWISDTESEHKPGCHPCRAAAALARAADLMEGWE